MMQWQAWKTLMTRYGAAFGAAWKQRRALAPPSLEAREREFLPAHLELRDTPAPPAPHLAMGLIVLFALLALLWAVLGHMEVVVSASGKLVPSGRSKAVQSFDGGVVKRIVVRDGDTVRRGDVLIELDATATQADFSKASELLAAARRDETRGAALLAALERGQLPRQDGDGDAGLARAQWEEYRARLQTLEAELAQRRAELASANEGVAKLAAEVPIARERAANFKELLAQQLVARHAWFDKEQERLDKEGQLAVQQARVPEARAAVEHQLRQISDHGAQFRRMATELRRTAQQQIAQAAPEEAKTRQRDRLMRLGAPIDGVVQQLAVFTVGGVVQPAQTLMVVVPQDEVVEVEALLENRDIGFVHTGQRAVTKVDAYAYSRYGYLEGRVVNVSKDAITDEKRGPLYQTRIKLPVQHLTLKDGGALPLSAGMAVTVDIHTDRRRIITYFLSPLMETTSESLRER